MEFEGFVDELIAEKGFDAEGPEITAQVKADLTESLEQRIDAMILTAMPEESLAGFESALDSGSDEVVQAYIREHIPDIDQKVAIELLNFRTSYLG